MVLNFSKMDVYSRHAYLYSAWTAMIIPCVLLTAMIFYSQPSQNLQKLLNLRHVLTFLPLVVFYALGYFLRDRIRATSEILFQYPFFKEDETRMPTTDLLMWNSDYPDEMKKAIRKKVKEVFGYNMPTKAQEAKDPNAARKTIAPIVGVIRKKARDSGDMVYTQANYRYGFNRNLLGGLVWSFALTLLLMIINIITPCIHWGWFVGALIFICLWVLLEFYVFLKYSARNYARQLFATFLTI
jgi:hypothetical protein